MGHLNEKQREAALHGDGPLLILAGAGSGKTSVMTHRIARLVLDEGADPRSILAVTFTNKAAGEMRERVAKLVYGEAAPIPYIWILTFHSACLRILHDHAERLGYTNNFAVYDPQDQRAVIRRCVAGLDLEPKMYNAAYVLAVIGGFKEEGKSPETVLTETENELVGPRRRDIAKIYAEYTRMLKQNNAMDFDDLLSNAVRLFKENPGVLAGYQKRFKYVMVDEYQDTNRLQYLFVRMLAERSGNLCVVGDDDQSIYGWRGADIRNILDFERDFPGAKVVKLEQNYRSYGNILACANSVIRGNRGRKEKSLWTERGEGEYVIYRQVYDEKDEARIVAEEIQRLADSGRGFRDMAVLTRTNVQARPFEEAFITRGIAYKMLGQTRYYDRKEVKDMLSYMSLVANPKDDVALIRVINEPRRGIGEKSVAAVAAAARLKGLSMLEFLTEDEGSLPLSGKAAQAAAEFAAVITGFSGMYEQMKVSEFYDELLAKSGYIKALEERGTVEDEGRVENLLEFRSVIVESEAENEELTLAGFLEKTALMSDVDNFDRNADAVVVMTMHSAKGLEFPVVFMPGMEEGLFPTARAGEREDGMEEERRLCYVGMTRAMDKLYLLRAKARTIYGHRDYTVESRFLGEIDPGVLDPNADMPGEDLSGYLHSDLTSGWGAAQRFSGSVFGKAAGSETGKRNAFGGTIAFDRARADVREREEVRALDVQAGDRVNHRKFGEGLVIEAAGGFATVMFDSAGRKKLALDLAPLEKI